MINFEKYGIDYDPKFDYNVIPCDLIAIGNLDRNIIETKVLEDNDTTITIKGEYDIKNKDAVVRGEIIKVISSVKSDGNTILTVERALCGTLKQDCVGYNFRTVVLLDEKNTEIDLIEWSFEDTTGSVTNNLFPVELGSGNVLMKSNLSLWSPTSISQKFRVRNRKTVVYIFKGVMGKRFLKFTTVVTKLGVNTRSKNDPNRIRLDIKTKLATWYDKDLSINSQLKGTTPKEFFKMLFGLNDNEVYYSDGVTEDSFLKINNLHTKEYKKVSEILKAYCSNGVRFCFDKYERLKIFSDFKIDNIQSQKTIFEDLTESTLTEDEAMIYNTINTKAVQRQTMYNFEDLQNKYVMYAKVLRNAISSNKFISREESGDYTVNTLEITNDDLQKSVQIGDIICFKRTKEPAHEYYAKVIDILAGSKVIITPILYDKDFKLFTLGKGRYMYNILNVDVCQMDLYYVRQELPMIFKYTRNKGGEEKDSSLLYPLLPRVNGETLYQVETNVTFGCASNLKLGSYTGIIEEVDKIYGTWSNNKLLYNRELDQFSNTEYPPIFVMTNKLTERKTTQDTPVLDFTNFDNSDFLLEINRPKDTNSDATIIMYNTSTVNKDIDLYIDTEITRKGNRILQVRDIDAYKLGDILIANKMDDFTPQEESEFEEVISSIRWRVTAKQTEVVDGQQKHYIFLDSNFAKRQSVGKKYSFTRFPNWSIVYLQELYFRGNPVIEFSQDIVGVAKGTNYDGDRSVDIYGEKKYEFDSKQLDKENMKKMMGYILDHFQAVNLQSTKFNVPISTFNGIDIELLDVITVLDPTHTQIDSKNKWLVVSVNNKSKTNVVQLKLLNINSSNAKPFKLDVKDVLEYKPVEIPTYDHTGSEGSGGENDGSGGDGDDKSIGVFNMSEVDPQIFRAKVEKFEDNYIYFKDFSGSEWETYAGKLFPESEFGVSIDGETILVHSDMRYRAFIKKRDIYNTGEQVVISPEAEIKFLIMTSFTDIDGQFYSRRCMIGDGDTYFKFHPITGAKFVGDFVIGEGNQHAGNDLWESIQKNRTFHQNSAPISNELYTLRTGDIWYDIDDENHVYRYNGDVWVSCRDGSIISTKSSTFIQPDEPVSTEGKPIRDGDTWYDTDDYNRPYVYQNGKWINVSDRTLEEAINQAKQQAQVANDKLSEIASDNKLTESEKQSTKKEWDIINAEYPKILDEATKFGVPKIGYISSYDSLNAYITPLLADLNSVSDIVGTDFRNYFKDYYNNRQTLLNDLNTAIKKAAVDDSKTYADQVAESLGKDLENQIDGKINTYNQEEDPSLSWNPEQKQKAIGDLWYKPSEKITKRWNGSSWENQDAKDTVAQALASQKRRVFTEQPTTPYDAGDLWMTNLTSTGDMMICVSTRASGNYVPSDWKKATKYTDDTKAQEAINNAEKAQQSANSANSLLTDIASDSKLTPSEKQATKKEWDIIVSEFQINLDQAKVYGISYTDYQSKYNELNGYITPLLANLNSTSDINGATFRAMFKNYYDSRQVLLNAISNKIKELADNAQNTATQALGNAKIFYQPTPPDGGMKVNDLWYDTDDGNHPYIYNGVSWISARDKIFETQGGNKVYFQATQPPTSGAGVKDGDMWFHTGANNKMYILLNGVWTLADDALDKVNTGRIVLNGNTTVNGDFRVRGNNIELNGATSITGILNVYGGDKGIVSYNGYDEPSSTKKIVIKGGVIEFWERI